MVCDNACYSFLDKREKRGLKDKMGGGGLVKPVGQAKSILKTFISRLMICLSEDYKV